MIKIIDSPTSSGKTSYLINKMNNSISDEHFIFVTPFISEIERVISQCSNRRFSQPTNNNKQGSKLYSLKQLIKQGRDIATTHTLFSMADQELIVLIKTKGYTLILDEVMDVVEQYEISKHDINILFEQKLIEVDEEYDKVIWKDDNYYGDFNHIKNLCYNEALYYINESFVLWSFPVNIFECFTNIFISTFMFSVQIQKYYYDYFNLEYEYYHIEKIDNEYTLVKTISFNYEKPFREQAKQLITIIDNPKLNAIGDYYKTSKGIKKSALSKTWYINNPESLKILNRNLYNFFTNCCTETKSNVNIWTTFKDYKSKLKGRGYTKGFVPCNCRATNDYMHTVNCAYMINRYLNPFYQKFFDKRGIEIDEDGYALSELIQWVWRSRLRQNQSINLYIPSQRMRELLIDYLKK